MIESVDEFIRLRTSQNPEEQRRATYEQAPEEIWFAILKEHPDMTFWVIHNKTVPLSILRHLADHPDEAVRRDVARKRKLDEDLFDKLSKDSNFYVRRMIAMNNKTPMEILKRLAGDEEDLVAEEARKRLSE